MSSTIGVQHIHLKKQYVNGPLHLILHFLLFIVYQPQQCILLLTEGPGRMDVCKTTNRHCSFVQCQPGTVKNSQGAYDDVYSL